MTDNDFDDDVDTPDETESDESVALKKRHQRAIDFFRSSSSFFDKQRKREVEDLKYIDFDDQWPADVKASRAGMNAVNGLPPVPPRPCETFNLLRAPVQQVVNTQRQARLTLQFAPKGDGATQPVAEVYEDIVRAIQTDSRAHIARNWAFDRSTKCGLGWYRIDTQYVNENPETDGPDADDQEIVYRRILNQASVYPDPMAQEPDFSDGRKLIVTQDLPIAEYKSLYPKSQLAEADQGTLTAIGDRLKSWLFTTTDSDGEAIQMVRIAEVWEVVEGQRVRRELEDGTMAYEDEAESKKLTFKANGRTRRIRTREVFFSKINAVEYLDEPQKWNGCYIPLIPTLADESNVDGERRWTGIVRPARGAQYAYNVLRSEAMYSIGLETKSPYMGYWETIEPFKEWWAQSPNRAFPILPLKFVRDANGSPLPMPQKIDRSSDISSIMMATAAAKDDVHSTSGVPPVALGALDPHQRSGRAIQALQGQSELGTSGYLDNLANITMLYEGRVIRDLIPRIYDRPGRIVPAVDVAEKRRKVMLNHPFVMGKDGVPAPIPGWEPGMPAPNGAEMFDLSIGELSVAVTVGKSAPTRREEASDAIGQVMKVVSPEMAAAMAPAWIAEQDWPGAKKISDIAVHSLPPQLQEAYQDGDGQQPMIPPQLRAQMAQMQQQLQQAQQFIQTKQAEQQATIEKARIDAQVKLQIEAMDNASREKIALIQATATMQATQAKVDAENARTVEEALENKLAKLLDIKLAHVNQLHERMTQMSDQTHEAGMAQLEHQHALEQGQQAAALAPVPAQGAENA